MADLFDVEDDDQFDPDKDYLTELVGEGKQYADEKALAKAAAAKEFHISKIERENAEFREKLQQAKTVEDLMDKLKARPSERQDEEDDSSDNAAEKDAGKRVSVSDIEKLVNEQLSASQDKKRRADNTAWIKSQLKERFGADAGGRLQQIAADLDLSVQDMTVLAEDKPKAFMRMIDDQKSGVTFSSPPSSRVNTTAMPQTSNTKNWKYYQGLRAKDKRTYDSAAVQAEMHREAIKQGAAFYD